MRDIKGTSSLFLVEVLYNKTGGSLFSKMLAPKK